MCVRVCVCVFTIDARMGRKSVAVATLLAHSVKTAMRRQRMMAMAQGGIECRGLSWSPSHRDKPDTWTHTHMDTYIPTNIHTHVRRRSVHNITDPKNTLHLHLVIWQTLLARATYSKFRDIPPTFPTHTSLPLAKANPPPRSSTMFQGIFFWVTCQVSRAGAGLWNRGPAGTEHLSHDCV